LRVGVDAAAGVARGKGCKEEGGACGGFESLPFTVSRRCFLSRYSLGMP
jgi:hypothetical protein